MRSGYILFSLALASVGLAMPQVSAAASTVSAHLPLCPACEPPICPMELRAECICKNAAAQKCWEENVANGYTACVSPTPTACPSYGTTSAEEKRDTCECEEMICAQSWPESCYCANEQKRSCYEKCGGVEPTYQVCNATVVRRDESASSTTAAVASSTSTSLADYVRCGTRDADPCPTGYVCVDDPASDCGTACDKPGYCVKTEGNFCGGFTGLRCPSGKTCVDDPRDGCDPENGGADCGGLCL